MPTDNSIQSCIEDKAYKNSDNVVTFKFDDRSMKINESKCELLKHIYIFYDTRTCF